MSEDKNTGKAISPKMWIPSIYFGMGLPFVVLSVVSTLMFTGLGIDDKRIAFWTSLIMFPWTLKPIWSPFLEIYKTKKFFVVTTEMITAISFGLVALTLPLPNFFNYSIALLAVVAFCGSTHDIAGDGIYMTELSHSLQSKYIGWQGASYNLAKILASGGLLLFAGFLEKEIGLTLAWSFIMLICGVIMLILSLYHIRIIPNRNASSTGKKLSDVFPSLVEIINSFFQKKHIGWQIIFIIMYRFAEGFAVKIVPLFLKAPIEKGGMGLDTSDIGLVYGTSGTVAFVIGSIIAGYFVSSRGLKKSLIALCCAFNIPFIVYLLLAVYRPESLWYVGGAVAIEYLGYGFGFVGLMLFMMQQIAPGKHQMSHYAFATAIMNIGVMLPGMFSGYLSDWLGYRDFFIWVLIATIPSFLVSIYVPFTHKDN